jgi:hypothetical protein
MPCHGKSVKRSAGEAYYALCNWKPVPLKEEMTALLDHTLLTGDFNAVMTFLTKHPYMVDFYIPQKGTTFVAAVMHGRPDLVEQLLELGADPLEFNCFSYGVNVFTMGYRSPKSKEALMKILQATKEWQEPSSVKAWQFAFRRLLEELWETGDFTEVDVFLKYRQDDLVNVVMRHGTLLSCAMKHSRMDKTLEYMNMGADPWHEGATNPQRFHETVDQRDIMNYMMEETGVLRAGEVFEYWV